MMEEEYDESINYLEIIEFDDHEDLQLWITDSENEEYFDILQHKILDYVFSEAENNKINLFLAEIHKEQHLVHIYKKDIVKILDTLMNFYAKLDDFNRCLVFKEAKEIILNNRLR